ncbi:hypothetical protein N7481_006335 [Penicillium waksmanii]|uniref:uncharacterized protein n=1 Tax=Penicillium waksmanii TaxID=69791 RepID=UPI002548849D|nr:uncharacterized protein N7481_006335 [Penicillium waksmanii]KAJ5984236.1 hypothetical protein N7481_006335 [Penicillium waksmanii]
MQLGHATLKRRLYLSSYYIAPCQALSSTYDHRVWRTGLPVRSAVLKPHAGRLVVWWVTTCESLLLYVFVHPLLFSKPAVLFVTTHTPAILPCSELLVTGGLDTLLPLLLSA